ncbi:MAG: SGNH/GDSL hydrolase family protein [Gammaproteobacteria bacterium]|nr:SGNH/GDSL hydrolase family protein [Gammaproteobacteria bacterium]
MKATWSFLAAIAVGAMAALLAPPVQAAAPEHRWFASWAAAPQDALEAPMGPTVGSPPPPVFDKQTLRQRFRPSLGGRQVRVRFSNLFGKKPLHIASAAVAKVADAASDTVSPPTTATLRFKGRRAVTIAPGAEVWSDAARFDAVAGQAAAVSFYLDQPTAAETVHRLPQEPTTTVPGNAVRRAQWRGAQPVERNHVVTGFDVRGKSPRVVVAFGDSITAGAGVDAAAARPERYPDLLAARLRAASGRSSPVGVVNAGIAGNRLLSEHIGPSGLQRFARDALGQSGVTHVLVLIGVNDIGFSQTGGAVPGFPPVSSAQLIDGLQQLLAQAREAGVNVLLGTLTPFKGAAYWSAEKEAERQAVNRWIRGQQAVDAVVDFDAALRSADDPAALDPRYDSGDHLHPGPAGYEAMAKAIDLRELSE